MKNFKTKLFDYSLLIGLAVVAFSNTAQAQGWNWGNVGLSMPNVFTNAGSLMDVVAQIITLAFGVSAIVAVIYLIIGGFSYVTSSGDPEAVQVAKATIVNAIIGLVVILASYLIIDFILDQLNANPQL